MAQEEKQTVVPMININHNDENTGLVIWLDLSGASKDSLDLDVGDEGFCIKAEGEDLRYEMCYTLSHKVIGEEATAKYDSGLLKITVPFKDALHGHNVNIE